VLFESHRIAKDIANGRREAFPHPEQDLTGLAPRGFLPDIADQAVVDRLSSHELEGDET
jgi:hypothetical protein